MPFAMDEKALVDKHSSDEWCHQTQQFAQHLRLHDENQIRKIVMDSAGEMVLACPSCASMVYLLQRSQQSRF